MRRVLVWALAAACALAGCKAEPVGPRLSPAEVKAVFIKGALPRTDARAKAWDEAPEHVARLLLQDQAEPRLGKVGVEVVRVRALHDGRWVALRLQWDDKSRDALAGPGTFSDAVAVQLPLQAGGEVPDGAMGQKGRPVRIHQWKAAWQDRIDGHVDAIAALYPNAKPDHYPYEAAKDPKARAEMEARYSPARAVGNPVTVGRPDAPVQDLVAEGFGSLTVLPEQVSAGRGTHDEGGWTVTIARPLDASRSEALTPGARTYAAFAVWDGGAGNVGARKMRSGWIPLSIDPVRP